MRVFVHGLWHLGCVTAACCASAGIHTVAFDSDRRRRTAVAAGTAPVLEPGLDDLISTGLGSGLLSVADELDAVRDADVVWVAIDTPVDGDDVADVDHVMHEARSLFPHLRDGAVVLISSQLPVGSTHALAADFAAHADGRHVEFAYSPENLRLGTAVQSFTDQDRVVIGTDGHRARPALEPLFAPFTREIIWVSVSSAEMTKHALNGFLAASVTFMNEVASICELVGADAREVERALRSERRIGAAAYVRPGAAIAGGTLARDVRYLQDLGEGVGLSLPLVDGILASNRIHGEWAFRHLRRIFADDLRGRTVAILGLTYKPGTSTLRRSRAVELGMAVARVGGRVRAHDPSLRQRPADLPTEIELCGDVAAALQGADIAVLATEWPEFRRLRVEDFVAAMPAPRLLDANGVLSERFRHDTRIEYHAVGVPA